MLGGGLRRSHRGNPELGIGEACDGKQVHAATLVKYDDGQRGTPTGWAKLLEPFRVRPGPTLPDVILPRAWLFFTTERAFRCKRLVKPWEAVAKSRCRSLCQHRQRTLASGSQCLCALCGALTVLSIAEQSHRATVITVALCHGSKVKPLSLQLPRFCWEAAGKKT